MPARLSGYVPQRLVAGTALRTPHTSDEVDWESGQGPQFSEEEEARLVAVMRTEQVAFVVGTENCWCVWSRGAA